MPGWPSSAASGPLTSMLSNATLIAWIRPHGSINTNEKRLKENEIQANEAAAAQTASVIKEKRNENQTDQRIRGRPEQRPALLYRGTGLCQEGRFQPGPISLADRGLA